MKFRLPSRGRYPVNFPRSEKKRAMEFYRALHDHLRGGILPSPEYGKFGKGGGVVDLYIHTRI
jgi:hypothetical protein